ncbi:MAG: aminotransferase class I/II-fold pyridoxal phosphate-dependent enzyme [Actinomycetales bacterium]|nr:aminotransferase class I/II-fold pyridoxal phosphate-dependent enzyme [Actinomycetales bacterium]
MKVARRAQVPPFAVMDIIAEANRRRAAGRDVLNLCAGEPATGASDVVRDRAAQILASGQLGYTEALGSPALRAEIAAHYARWYGVELDPARIAVTTGSSGGFVLAFLAAFDVGDRVVLARPGYPAYRNVLDALGCEVVEIDCGPESRYQPTVALLEALDGPIDGLVVASPANPTGTMIEPSELDALATWCAAHGVRLISDEIYHGITYAGAGGAGASGPGGAGPTADGPTTASYREPAPTAAHYLHQGAIVVNSFSKFWAMTGWRLGWLVLPDDVLPAVDALAGNVALCPPALSQDAAIAAFSEAGYAAAFANVERYAAARELILARLPELGWDRVAPADGAFYVYADISASGLDSREWCARLLAEADVALTPGTDFDPVHGHAWVRLSFASDVGVIGTAVDRIVAWQATLSRP